MSLKDTLPDAHFGSVGAPVPNWREYDEPDPDDELLPDGTPQDVIMMLGFDPRELDEPEPTPTGDAEFQESKVKRDKDGKFSSTGGGGGSTPKPSPSGPKNKVLPQLAKHLHEQSGSLPTPESFHKELENLGVKISPQQSVKYLKGYSKGQYPDFLPPGKEAAKPAEKSAEAKSEAPFAGFVNTVEKHDFAFSQTAAGGTLIEYESPLGETVVANKETGEWVHYGPTGASIAKGNGPVDLSVHLDKHSKEPAKKEPEASPEELENLNKLGALATILKGESGIGGEPTTGEFMEIAKNSGLKVTEAQAKEFGFKEGKPKTETESTPQGKIDAIGAKANSVGLNKEGTFNGIEYWKAGANAAFASGVKVSYKPDENTWRVLGTDGSILKQGTGYEGLISYMDEKSIEAQSYGKEIKPVAAKAPASAPTYVAPAPPPKNTSTENAPAYGRKVKKEFQYTSKGIADETALPDGVRASISRYKGSHYKEINKKMRFNSEFTEQTVSKQELMDIANLTLAFNQTAPTQKDVTLTRKIYSDDLKTMLKDAGIGDLKDLKAGDVLTEYGVTSTSHGDIGWSGNVRFTINAPKGTKAIDLSETINPGEKEVLLPPYTRFKVSSVETNGNNYHLKVDVV